MYLGRLGLPNGRSWITCEIRLRATKGEKYSEDNLLYEAPIEQSTLFAILCNNLRVTQMIHDLTYNPC